MLPTPPDIQPGFPGTVDQTKVCNQEVFNTTLVDRTGITYGTVRMFKDYNDMLFVTLSLNALVDFIPLGQVHMGMGA